MNTHEKKYLMQRLGTIKGKKMSEINKELPEVRGLNAEEKVNLIRQGKVPFKMPKEISIYTSLYPCFDYSAFEPDNTEVTAERERRVSLLDKELCRLEDTIMLGEAGEALRLLREFEEKEF